jgi:hypothetical protein
MADPRRWLNVNLNANQWPAVMIMIVLGIVQIAFVMNKDVAPYSVISIM